MDLSTPTVEQHLKAPFFPGYSQEIETAQASSQEAKATGHGAMSPGAIPQEQIADRAYYLWQQRGCPIGTDQEDWFEAERHFFSASTETRGAVASNWVVQGVVDPAAAEEAIDTRGAASSTGRVEPDAERASPNREQVDDRPQLHENLGLLPYLFDFAWALTKHLRWTYAFSLHACQPWSRYLTQLETEAA